MWQELYENRVAGTLREKGWARKTSITLSILDVNSTNRVFSWQKLNDLSFELCVNIQKYMKNYLEQLFLDLDHHMVKKFQIIVTKKTSSDRQSMPFLTRSLAGRIFCYRREVAEVLLTCKYANEWNFVRSPKGGVALLWYEIWSLVHIHVIKTLLLFGGNRRLFWLDLEIKTTWMWLQQFNFKHNNFEFWWRVTAVVEKKLLKIISQILLDIVMHFIG